jgi:hypothetical protein
MNTVARGSSRDNDILATMCSDPGTSFRVNVDDFDDPGEDEISGEEIHLTVVRRNARGEDPACCLKLSTTSAKILIEELAEAIRKREIP